MHILAVDVGTTAMKMGVFGAADHAVRLIRQFSREYAVNTYNDGLFSDIEPEKWQNAFLEGCKDLADLLKDVDAVALSGTTPGFTVMDPAGHALYPAILMLDQRSRRQANEIIDAVGIHKLLETTSNMPVAGGCSLASLLWIRDHRPDVYTKMAKLGHSNTFMGKWLTGNFAIDPSSASLTALLPSCFAFASSLRARAVRRSGVTYISAWLSACRACSSSGCQRAKTGSSAWFWAIDLRVMCGTVLQTNPPATPFPVSCSR